jgi:hypothetical protein
MSSFSLFANYVLNGINNWFFYLSMVDSIIKKRKKKEILYLEMKIKLIQKIMRKMKSEEKC